VHDLAENALRRHGWKQKGELWTRPGKELRQGCSSIYNLYGPEGVYIMTNFSSNASPFVQNKSYSDCQIISELEYHGNFKKCISELANRFLDRKN
jgi:chaperonin GroEL (HSP60 family)